MQKIQTFLKENKNLMISIAIILVIIVLGLVFSKDKNTEKDNSDNKSDDSSVVDENTESPKPYIGSNPKSAPVPRLSYEDALIKYSSSRIQFGDTCIATPFMSTYKNNTKIMLDNRSGESKTFVVGSISHFVPAYDYTLVTLAYSNLPQTIYIDCGKQLNVATILVQE